MLFGWVDGWLGGLGTWKGTHRREFLLENMNGGRSTVQAITPLYWVLIGPFVDDFWLVGETFIWSLWLVGWSCDLERDT